MDAAALPAGYHRITLQFRDSTNAWSVPSTSLFYRNSGNLTAYQYWFDDNVSTLVEMTVGATDVIDITTQINAGALIDGSHTITLRTKDARNGFSVPVTYSFDVITGIAELRGVERVILFPTPLPIRSPLRVDASLPQDLQLSVLDASGRTVRAPERLAFNGAGVREFALSALPSGSYSLLITNHAVQQRVPFVKH
ncbi:MAG: hypothetical protein IPI55_00640 [Flavobacteriales bacterium]|nr:hypothetical protein [Flavobacteriales bacterium]